MKNIIVEVPRDGATVQLVLRGGASSGQAVIVASDEVEIRLAGPAAAPVAQPRPPAGVEKAGTRSREAPSRDLDAILARLTKLQPSRRTAAIHSIKSMFQLTEPISDEAASTILDDLRRRGSVSIDTDGKLQIRGAQQRPA